MRRASMWRASGVLLALTGVLMAIADHCRAPASTAPKPATEPSSSARAPVPARPRRWFGRAAPARPAPLEVDRQEAWRAQWAGRRSTRPVLSDPVSLSRLHDAQRLVAEQGELAQAWRWPEVRGAVAELGHGIPMKAPGATESVAGVAEVAYEFLNEELVVFPSAFREASTEHLAEVLVHEATHAVYARVVMEQSKLTPLDLTALCSLCVDVDDAFRFASEALAYRTEALWARSRSRLAASSVRVLLEAALDAEDGGELHRSVFARHVRQVGEMSAVPQRAEVAKQHAMGVCGPPIVVTGPRRGEYFYPSDPAPDVLVPLFNAGAELP